MIESLKFQRPDVVLATLPPGLTMRPVKEAAMAIEETTTQNPFEEWRAIPGYEGRYEASDRGGVRSLYFAYRKPPPPRYPLCTPSTDGYPCVGLSRGGAWKHFRVHILVMLAFVG